MSTHWVRATAGRFSDPRGPLLILQGDFASNALATGRGVSVLAIVDAFTRECLVLEVDTVLLSQHVIRFARNRSWKVRVRFPGISVFGPEPFNSAQSPLTWASRAPNLPSEHC
jgi:hypothetical protein